ncbi:MAG: cyclic pyranopterin monophosphate synthase MoaC [Candidatus Xenobia bacterium]
MGRGEEARLTHVDDVGAARMVDVGDKPQSKRTARARGSVRVQPSTMALIRDNALAKGDVLSVARVAGIMGAKETARLIPLCHPLITSSIQVDLRLEGDDVVVEATVGNVGQTGPEMEALTAVSIACLTIYDMCKGVDRSMQIGPILLLGKTGGKSDR